MSGSVGRSGGSRKPFLPTMKLDGKATDLPEKPGGLSDGESKCWDSILSKLPTECLAPIDVFELTELVRLVVQSDELNQMIKADPSNLKARRLSLQVFAAIHKLSAVFGMTPADRSRLGMMTTEAEPDPFLDYLSQG